MPKTEQDTETLTLKEGDILTFDVLTWQHEGYEFGRPCLMLSPVICENSDSNPDSLIEDTLIRGCVDGKLPLNREKQQIEWRGWNLKYFRRCFNQALAGKKFPVAWYEATRQKVKIIRNKHGDLSWENLP